MKVWWGDSPWVTKEEIQRMEKIGDEVLEVIKRNSMCYFDAKCLLDAVRKYLDNLVEGMKILQ